MSFQNFFVTEPHTMFIIIIRHYRVFPSRKIFRTGREGSVIRTELFRTRIIIFEREGEGNNEGNYLMKNKEERSGWNKNVIFFFQCQKQSVWNYQQNSSRTFPTEHENLDTSPTLTFRIPFIKLSPNSTTNSDHTYNKVIFHVIGTRTEQEKNFSIHFSRVLTRHSTAGLKGVCLFAGQQL